ncbi:MAG: 2-enoyl thioester reductase domain-containing protein [Verrucomicrobiota bacterium]
MSSRRLLFREFGNPSEVLELNTVEEPPLEAGFCRVEALLAPINPADLNFVEGVYGKRPELPAVPGVEGVVRVLEAPNGGSLKEGDLAIVPGFTGTWQEQFVLPAESLIVVPASVALEQLAMLKVNPPTALLMLREFVDLQPGDWVVQNGANSAVGRCVIQIAKKRRLRTLNVVRREELFSELRDLGADAVVLDGENTIEEAKDLLAGESPRLALNTVGGDSALRLMALLGPGGEHITYGAMSLRSLKVPNRFLIFDDIHIRGFWVTRWMERVSMEQVKTVFEELSEMMKRGELVMPVDQVFPLEDFRAAIERAKEGGRNGKVLLKFC